MKPQRMILNEIPTTSILRVFVLPPGKPNLYFICIRKVAKEKE
jgi:hypothetical protein